VIKKKQTKTKPTTKKAITSYLLLNLVIKPKSAMPCLMFILLGFCFNL